MEEALKTIPDSIVPIFVTLALSFLIGLEREEHAEGKYYNFGGVRTFPIIGLCGYLMAKLSYGQPVLLAAGVLLLGSLFWLSYKKKLELSSKAGMTSEISGLFTFLLGALVFEGALWEATALAVIVLLLLELKSWLEALARKIPLDEIFTFTRFLLILGVILPIIPNREFTGLHINPFHTWLIVVVVSGMSYSAYVLKRILGSGKSIVLTAVLGGLYSSTSTTVVLAKRSKNEKAPQLFSGAILIASGIMYFRLVALLFFFNTDLGERLMLPFLALGVLFVIAGWLWIATAKQSGRFRLGSGDALAHEGVSSRNPLELQSAFVFALLFTLMGLLTLVVRAHLGTSGIYGLSFFTGLTDVDPFVMSLTQTSGTTLDPHVAASGIVIATASNNIMKGIYAGLWGGDGVRRQGAGALIGLALLSVVALFFI